MAAFSGACSGESGGVGVSGQRRKSLRVRRPIAALTLAPLPPQKDQSLVISFS